MEQQAKKQVVRRGLLIHFLTWFVGQTYLAYELFSLPVPSGEGASASGLMLIIVAFLSMKWLAIGVASWVVYWVLARFGYSIWFPLIPVAIWISVGVSSLIV